MEKRRKLKADYKVGAIALPAFTLHKNYELNTVGGGDGAARSTAN